MFTFTVSLTSVEAVKRFVNQTALLPCEVDVRSGRYVVDGKSIMGLFSIDLSEPVIVEVHGTQAQADALRAAVAAH